MSASKFDEYLKRIKKYLLKISDVTKLREGECLELLFFDRNFFDFVDQYSTKYKTKSIDLAKFAKQDFGYQGIYKHNHDLQGHILWYFDTPKHNRKCDHRPKESFEFHLNYEKSSYYPLKNGKLPGRKDKDWQTQKKYDNKSYKSFPKSTLIGWRGPAIRISDLKKLPKLKYDL
jgi:hypothetical protein